MSASERLRALLRAENVEYGQLGACYTSVTLGGRKWVIRDNYDGTVAIHLGGRFAPEDAVALVCGSTAEMLVVSDEDGVGHSECRACGRTVGQHFNYCPWCGARFTEIERMCKA